MRGVERSVVGRDVGAVVAKRWIQRLASEGGKRYQMCFTDDDDAVEIEFELESANPPFRMLRRVPRESVMRKFSTGADEIVDRILREFLFGTPDSTLR